MSWDVYVVCSRCKEPIHFDEPHEFKGGTYPIGGTYEATLNITYNYSKHYYATMGEGGLRGLDGQTVAATMDVLAKAIDALDQDVSDDYWEPTQGNARLALMQLRSIAERCPPDSLWVVH